MADSGNFSTAVLWLHVQDLQTSQVSKATDLKGSQRPLCTRTLGLIISVLPNLFMFSSDVVEHLQSWELENIWDIQWHAKQNWPQFNHQRSISTPRAKRQALGLRGDDMSYLAWRHRLGHSRPLPNSGMRQESPTHHWWWPWEDWSVLHFLFLPWHCYVIFKKDSLHLFWRVCIFNFMSSNAEHQNKFNDPHLTRLG